MVDVARRSTSTSTRADWRVNANANQGYSLGGLILNVSGKVTPTTGSRVYPREIGEAHRCGDCHIHDLDMLAGYCAGWSLRTLLNEGFNGVPGKVEAARRSTCPAPSADGQLPGHAAERVGGRAGLQLVRHLPGALRAQGQPALRPGAPVHPGVRLQPERALALGHADAVHQPHASTGPAPRTCATSTRSSAAWRCLHLRRLEAEMDADQPRVHRGHDEGDAKGRVFTFPIPTYNITPDFDWEHPNATRCSR
jgi:ribonucleoside-triphosphate reductase (formate)